MSSGGRGSLLGSFLEVLGRLGEHLEGLVVGFGRLREISVRL
jgi:hypothetical protein